jgi:ElaB/YqjD/DUF883 family membrane-anchored ribosome-binding protein
MDPEPDVIRHQIEETRSSLTDKLETLEAEVLGTVHTARDTVESAKETVEETIESVKETVANAKESVKRTFDIPYQVDRHPWGMVGLSALAGAVAGALLAGRMSPGRRVARRMSAASVEPLLRDEEPRRPGLLDRLGAQLGDEFEKAKELAVSTIAGVVGDVARRSIPALRTAVEDMMARAATHAAAPPQQFGEERPQRGDGARYQAPPTY